MKNLSAKVIALFTVFYVIYQGNCVDGDAIGCENDEECAKYCCLRYEASYCEPADGNGKTGKTCLCCPISNSPPKQGSQCGPHKGFRQCQCFEPQTDGEMVSLEKNCCGDSSDNEGQPGPNDNESPQDNGNGPPP